MKNVALLIIVLFSALSWGQTDISHIQVNGLDYVRQPLSEVISKDKYTLLSVGGTWCMPCLEQKPFVTSLEQQYPQFLKVVFLFSRDTREKVMSKFNITDISTFDNYFLIDESDIFQLAVKSYPTNILVDTEGKVVSHDIAIKDVSNYMK